MSEEPLTPARPAQPGVVPQHEAEAHLRSLLDNAEGFVLYRIQAQLDEPFGGEVALASQSICGVMGIDDPGDFSSWFRNVHPDDLPVVVAANARAAGTGEPFAAEREGATGRAGAS